MKERFSSRLTCVNTADRFVAGDDVRRSVWNMHTASIRTVPCVVLVALLSLIVAPRPGVGQWIEAPGHGWVQVSLYHHDTRDRFDPLGNVEPLFNEGGRSITTSLFLTGVVGLYRGVDVWAQIPVHRLEFNDVAATRQSFGPGDPLVHLRIGPELFGVRSPVPVAVRAGVKFPLGDFSVDSEIVPLTEGQRDWEVLVELGHSFYPAPLYAMGWVGYRWRETNHEIERKPGDERFGFFAIGGAYPLFSWKLAAEALYGERWISFTGVRIPLSRSERELVQVTPTVGWKVGPGGLEAGARIPVAGQNFPAGPALFLGYFMRWGRP